MKKRIGLALLFMIVAASTIFLHISLGNKDAHWRSLKPVSYIAPSESLNQPQYDFPNAEETIVAKVPLLVNAPVVDGERLFKHVQELNFERYTTAERDRTRKYIAESLTASGWVPTEQAFDEGVNVVAQRSGTDANAGTILLGAHYDTVQGSPGADDNASGVAALLEIARLLGSRPTPRSLQLVFFDREETGLKGSIAFTNSQDNLKNLQAAIILDMIGFACHTSRCQQIPKGLPLTSIADKGDFIAIAGNVEHSFLLDLFQENSKGNYPSVLTLPVPLKGLATPDLLRSDHAPFWYREVGAVLVSDTANFRSPHYHRGSDRPETIDRKFFTGTTQAIVNVTTALLSTSKR